MNLLKLHSVDSTNSWLAAHEANVISPAMVYCHRQTAGRGQRGNHWESEPGMNITASLIFHPVDFPAVNQFAISELISLAITDFLEIIFMITSVLYIIVKICVNVNLVAVYSAYPAP